MATNYSLSQAVEIIAGENTDELLEIGKKYPLATLAIAKILTAAGEDFMKFMDFMPEHLSINKVNIAMKASLGNHTDDDVEEEEVEEKPKAKAKPKAKPKAKKADDEEDAEDEDDGELDFDSMSAKELYDFLGSKGITGKARGKNVTEYRENAKRLFGNGADVEEAEDEGEDWGEDDEGEDYGSMSAPDLFKLCKSRGIKAAPKKNAKFYADLLKKDDALQAKEADADGEDWDEDEEEEEKPKAKPKAKAKAKPKAKKEEDEDEDDESWEI